MSEQALQLKEVIDNCNRGAKIITISSGKGGVGKSNIAANLAVCLSASGKKVVLVDADMSLGNIDVIMNCCGKYNISHLLDGRKTIEDIIHTGPQGVDVICGASGMENLADISEFQRQRMLKELSRLQEDYDVILIDNAAGISRSVIGFCIACHHSLVVTTPEATAMTDAYAMIKVLVKNGFQGRISLIVNMADSIVEGRKIYRQISKVATRFLGVNVYDAGVLLKDPRLCIAVRNRRPVVLAYPKAPITRCFAALTSKLGTSPAVLQQQNFFRKVADYFF
ncbi:MAG: MinD/ParA family protein [Phycisphaerae bacterium]|nr:MinD/ParA family protein [Phycisphaerae bacterium]